MQYLLSHEIILLVLQLHCEAAVLHLIPIFTPVTGYVWRFVVTSSPGTLQRQTDRIQHDNLLSLTCTCVEML